MRIWIVVALIAGLTACVSRPEADSVSATVEEVNTGRTIAENKCSACHAIGATGSSPFREAPPFRLLSDRYPIRDLEEALAEGIVTGHPAMPVWIFEPTEISDLLGYIESVQPR